MFITCVVIALVVVEAISNAFMDNIVHHFNRSKLIGMSMFFFRMGWFKTEEDAKIWWGPLGWTNKYISRDPKKGRKKWLIINKPLLFCDAWHLFKTISIGCYIAAIVAASQIRIEDQISEPIICFLLLCILRNIVFTLFYKKILR